MDGAQQKAGRAASLTVVQCSAGDLCLRHVCSHWAVAGTSPRGMPCSQAAQSHALKGGCCRSEISAWGAPAQVMPFVAGGSAYDIMKRNNSSVSVPGLTV